MARETQDRGSLDPPEGAPLAALKIKLTDDHELGPLPAELRERRQEELIYSQKTFNNILKLKKLLLSVFNQHAWECVHSGAKFTFKNKINKNEVVVVDKLKNEIRLSGNPIAKLIEASSRYEQETGVDIDYAIEALSLADAAAMLNELHKNHADIWRITKLDLKSKTPYVLKEIIAKIKNETTANLEKNNSPTPEKKRK